MLLYKNAVPWTYFAGINDTPRSGIAPATLKTSAHTVFSMIKAPWGKLNTPVVCVNGSEVIQHFGEDVFEIDQPFYNYQSVLVEWIGSQGTPQYVSRMELPGMAKSNCRLYIEAVEHTFPIYTRGIDGSYSYDLDGNLIPTGEYVDGYKFRLRAANNVADFSLGNGKITDPSALTGQLIDRDADGNVANPSSPTYTATTGRLYPIMDLEGRWMGALGNRILTEIYAPKDADSPPGKTSTIEDTGLMMYRMGHLLKRRSGGGARQMYTVNDDSFINFSLKPDSLNTAGTAIYGGEVYENEYSLVNQTYTGANVDAPCRIKFYDENILMLQEMFHAAELAASLTDATYPCWIDEDNVYSINLFGNTDHYDIPYHALGMMDITEDPVDDYYSPYVDSRFQLAGGNDGTTTDEAYNVAVQDFCDNVTAMFPIFDKREYQLGWTYDMGYQVATKKKLYRLMAENESLIVVNATDEFGEDPRDYSDTLSIAIALNSAYGLYPESSVYKTEATRGAIVPYSVKIKNHKYRKPVPATFSLAKKLNNYLGASTLVWDTNEDPMLEKNKIIDEVLVNFEALNLTKRTNFWVNQLVVLETVQHQSVGFAGLQTINGNDSSVLNNLLVIAATGHALRAGYEAAAVFRGQTAAPSVIAKRHRDRIIELCAGIDPSKAVVSVNSYQTTDDYNAGYAITDTITVSGNQAITAVTLELNSQYLEEE